MNYRFLILVIFIYLVPFQILKRVYLIDKESFKIAKILNILITLLMAWYITDPGNTIIEIILDFKSFKNTYHIDSGLINADMNLISKIILNCLYFYMIIVVFNLTRRNGKYRMIFVRLIPFLLIFMTIDVNRDLLWNGSCGVYFGFYLMIAFFWTLIICTPFYLIYNIKIFKQFMCLNNEKIKELVLKKNNGSA